MPLELADLKTWLEYGLLGLIILGLLRGWIVPRWAYTERTEENTRLKKEVEAQTEANQELAQAFTQIAEGLRGIEK